MDDAFSFRGSGVLLFDEDFDVPPPSQLGPEVIEPVFSAAELFAAREEAALASREATLAEVDACTRAASGLALTEISTQIAAARADMAAVADQSAEAMAGLLLNCFATAFPALSARHGGAEAVAMMRAILPALHHEPKITVRINPYLVAALTEELLSLDGDLAARVRLVPTNAIAMGDARVVWENGSATRDAASLWQQIESILAPAGLLRSPGQLIAAEPPGIPQTVKEHDLVE